MTNITQWYPSIESGGAVVGRFDWENIPDQPASVAADEPRFKKIPVLWTKITGVNTDVSCQKVKPHNQAEFVRRFPEAWRAFQGEAVEVEGTPLSELDGMTGDRINFLNMAGIFTVEQMAVQSDAQCQTLGFGYRMVRDAAQKHDARMIEEAARQSRIDRLPQPQQTAPAVSSANGAAPVTSAEAATAATPLASEVAPVRSRGWPLGKPRGPRMKIDEPAQIDEPV